MALPCKVSVIVPVYNVEKYLPECLESLIDQTLLDIEIICVNDHSTDGSAEILKQYAERDNRIVLLDNPKKGSGSARNIAMEKAHGAIIMFCDADDRYLRHACERVWLEFKNHPIDAVVFGTALFPEIGDIPGWIPWILQTHYKRHRSFVPEIIFNNPGAIPFVWRNAFSTEMVKRSGVRFPEDLDLGEDTLFQLEIFPYTELGVSILPDRLYEYRWIRPGSLMHLAAQDHDKRIVKHLDILSRAFEFYRETGFMEKYGPGLLDWTLRFIVPDAHQEDVKDRTQHLKALWDLIRCYGMEKFLSDVPRGSKALVRKLLKSQKD